MSSIRSDEANAMKKIATFNVLLSLAAFAVPEELIRNGSFEEMKGGYLW